MFLILIPVFLIYPVFSFLFFSVSVSLSSRSCVYYLESACRPVTLGFPWVQLPPEYRGSGLRNKVGAAEAVSEWGDSGNHSAPGNTQNTQNTDNTNMANSGSDEVMIRIILKRKKKKIHLMMIFFFVFYVTFMQVD